MADTTRTQSADRASDTNWTTTRGGTTEILRGDTGTDYLLWWDTASDIILAIEWGETTSRTQGADRI